MKPVKRKEEDVRLLCLHADGDLAGTAGSDGIPAAERVADQIDASRFQFAGNRDLADDEHPARLRGKMKFVNRLLQDVRVPSLALGRSGFAVGRRSRLGEPDGLVPIVLARHELPQRFQPRVEVALGGVSDVMRRVQMHVHDVEISGRAKGIQLLQHFRRNPGEAACRDLRRWIGPLDRRVCALENGEVAWRVVAVDVGFVHDLPCPDTTLVARNRLVHVIRPIRLVLGRIGRPVRRGLAALIHRAGECEDGQRFESGPADRIHDGVDAVEVPLAVHADDRAQRTVEPDGPHTQPRHEIDDPFAILELVFGQVGADAVWIGRRAFKGVSGQRKRQTQKEDDA